MQFACISPFLTTLRVVMNTDRQALQQWYESQHVQDEPEINVPTHNLDAMTVLAMIQLICVPSETGTISWRTALRRLAVIASIVSPDIGRLTLDRISRDLTNAGVITTRAALSSISCQLRDIIGFTRSDKSDKAREAYRKRARKAWSRKAKTVDNQ